ncbi:hypothetical protein [Coxiella-like endosymbiont]|uniref:hypothetical protein n=1 Tax=Coxiella-like endosymbiont TaxID=1592897 RepID=UPI00272AF746|nr:hypothetical protein [Coxiella-like endosymbiont]
MELEIYPGGWPFCFPVCARLKRQWKEGVYLFDGTLYQLKIDGFLGIFPGRLRKKVRIMLF